MDEEEVLRLIDKAARDGRTELDLSSEGLKTLPPEIGKLKNLTLLYLFENQLTALPPEIGELKNLTRLILVGNQLTALPPEIGELKNLTLLYLDGNQLTALPPEIGELKNLTSLYLFENQLTALPPEIGELQNLTLLYLGRNQLTALPPEIGELKNLTSLYLFENQLTALPPEIWRLKNLILLSLVGNQLTALPPEIGELKNLTSLYLHENQLTALPPEIGELKNLTRLSLAENPLEFPPPGVIEKGTVAILSFLRNLETAGEIRRYEAKLLLLGDGDEGKTCLSRALRGLPFEKQVTTHGVDIFPWEFPHPEARYDEEKKITLNIWDFEGQEITHQSHQFFMTQRSLYVLVFNGRRRAPQMERLEYWLDTIRSRAPGCQVVLVATECEDLEPQFSPDRLRQKYGDILASRPYFAVGCKAKKGQNSGKNIPEVRDYLAELAAGLELMGQGWPKNYSEAEKAIKKRAEDKAYTTRRALYEILASAGIPQQDYDNFAALMGDLGVITHFPDCPDLQDFIVLKPQWLTKAISKALESEELVKKQGECDHHWLNEVWDKDYPGLFQKFHSCMKEFELCYQLEDNPNLSLVPLRFPYLEPEIPWTKIPHAKERKIEYRFDVTPPAGLFSRFIVKTHHFIVKTEAKPYGVYWNNGVFLRTGEGPLLSEALCVMDPYQRTMSITVKAAFPQNMVEQLHGFAKAVFGFFKGLTPKRYYGCVRENETQCSGSHSERSISYALTKEDKTVDCEDELHDVDALFLITGFSSFAESPELRQMLREELDKQPKWAEKFGNDFQSIVARLDSYAGLFDKQVKASEEVLAVLYQMRQQLQRDLLNLLDERELNKTPAIVSIIPVESHILNPKRFFKQKYILRPYCEHEDGPHPGDWYCEFERTKEWWQKTAPYLAVGLRLLSLAVHPALAGLPSRMSQEQLENMSNDVNLMEELFGALPEIEGEKDLDIEPSKRIGTKGKRFYDLRKKDEIDEYRVGRQELAMLMKELSPANYEAKQWGELRRIRMSDGSLRWLCDKHAEEYRRACGI